MARGLVPRGHLLASCHRKRSVNCHGEESFKTTRPSCFCHYERSTDCHRERSAAIYWQRDCFCLYVPSQVTRLGLSSRTQCGDLLARRLPRRVFYTSRNDKKCRIKNTPSQVTSRWQVFSQVTRNLFAI
jgi:hypothetical protein